MPIADRPVSGASIESVWGQQVHDYTFAPAGVRATTGSSTTVGTTFLGLDLDTVVQDPGGYLDVGATQIEVPTGGEGLYILSANFNVTGSVNDQIILAGYALNGTITSTAIIYGQTGSTVKGTLPDHLTLTAGDILDFRARRVGAPNVDVTCTVSLIRVGAEYGTP